MSPMDKFIDILAAITLVIITAFSLIRGHKKIKQLDQLQDNENPKKGDDNLEDNQNTGGSQL